MDAAGWDARYSSRDLVWGAQPNRFVVAEFADLPPGRVIDLAAGEGRNAVWLAERGWTVTAVDFSAVAAERGRELARAHGVEVDWVVADLAGYRPEPGRYDAVLVAYLQLPADDLAGVLRRAVEGLAPGGRIVVIGHDLANLTEGVGGPPSADVLHTVEGVVAALDGLDVQRAERARRPVPVEGGTRDAIDTVVRAVRRPTPDGRPGGYRPD
jgi:SAM-dependent methyltransferase